MTTFQESDAEAVGAGGHLDQHCLDVSTSCPLPKPHVRTLEEECDETLDLSFHLLNMDIPNKFPFSAFHYDLCFQFAYL